MKLMNISEYRRKRFVGTQAPSLSTLKRWIQSGEIPGRKIGGRYYVDMVAESKRSGDAKVDEILEDIGEV